jgi:hypothetical protein
LLADKKKESCCRRPPAHCTELIYCAAAIRGSRMAAASPVWIVTARGAPPIRCAVSDITPDGGCLIVGQQTFVPDRFALYTSFQNKRGRPCGVVWRNEGLIGFQFIAIVRAERHRKATRF